MLSVHVPGCKVPVGFDRHTPYFAICKSDQTQLSETEMLASHCVTVTS